MQQEDTESKVTAMTCFVSSSLYSRDKKHAQRVLEVMKFVENLWPFNNVESYSYQLQTSIDGREVMSIAILKHSFYEVYGAFIRWVAPALDGAMIHTMLDLWTDPISRRKFLGVRVSCTDADMEFKTYLIAIREFKITSMQSKTKQWSKCILLHIERIMDDFGLSWDQVIGGTTDAGSDIKKIMQEKLGYMWEWCVSHMLHRMASDTFKLLSIQELVQNMRSIFSSLKTRTNKLLFDGKSDKKNGKKEEKKRINIFYRN